MSGSPSGASTSPPQAPAQAQAGPTVVVQGEVSTTFYPVIEADDFSSSESAYDANSDLESDTTSLKSSVLNYYYENGRRYHSRSVTNQEYFVPNDEVESDRLDLTHHVMTIMQKGKLHAAPIGDHPQKIMDIGTGTGIWAIEMADMYPSAIVIGNDLSPIQPGWVPPNVQFVVEDIEDDWTYDANTFDLIYCRYLLGSIRNWPRLVSQAYKALKPGGYLEILEPDSHLHSDDNTLPEDSPLMQWNNAFIDAAEKGVGSIVEAPKYKDYIVDAGYVEIHEDVMKLPNSGWPKNKWLKEAGQYHLPALLDGLEPLSIHLLTTVGGMSLEETQALFAKARANVKDKSIHTYFNLHRYVARKPLHAHDTH
ncbi:hypothetical protein H072_1866 [Dactylellina haptotyla CBS 200.50]|uniref:Methyltransferase domain-containing protein n=1 Tax=Dactylellina haptotyla (strain CBS 200.50) TaxID=1284197 RepID=S8BX83_DACHA|nr:hypothetical protein H072_1866 [Dactylellina haptotyla CBS 200.50]